MSAIFVTVSKLGKFHFFLCCCLLGGFAQIFNKQELVKGQDSRFFKIVNLKPGVELFVPICSVSLRNCIGGFFEDF